MIYMTSNLLRKERGEFDAQEFPRVLNKIFSEIIDDSPVRMKYVKELDFFW